MSILTAAAVRLAVFARKDIQTLTKDDQMEIEMMSEEDTVTFSFRPRMMTMPCLSI